MIEHEKLPPSLSQLFSNMVDQASKHHPELFKLAMVLALGQNCCECVNKSNHPWLGFGPRAGSLPVAPRLESCWWGWLTLTHPSSGNICLEIKDRGSSAAGVPQGA